MPNRRLTTAGPASGRVTELYTLGGVRVICQGADETSKLGPRHVALLVYLYHEARPLHPSELVDLLGRGQDEEKELDRLGKAINWLRNNVTGVDISMSSDTVEVYGGVRLDTREVDAAIDSRDPEHIAGLYVGEFLEGFESGAPAFDEWAQRERGRLQRAWGNAMLGCAREAERSGDWHVAGLWWKVLASRAPMRGDAVAGLLQAYAKGARWEEAAQVYGDYAARLKNSGISKVAQPVSKVIVEHPKLRDIAKGRGPVEATEAASGGSPSEPSKSPVDPTAGTTSEAEAERAARAEPSTTESPRSDSEGTEPEIIPIEPDGLEPEPEIAAGADEAAASPGGEEDLDVDGIVVAETDSGELASGGGAVAGPEADEPLDGAGREPFREFLEIPPVEDELEEDVASTPERPAARDRARPPGRETAETEEVDPLKQAHAAARSYVTRAPGETHQRGHGIRHEVTSVRKPWGPALKSAWEELKPWLADVGETALKAVLVVGRALVLVPVQAGRGLAGLIGRAGSLFRRRRAERKARAEREAATVRTTKEPTPEAPVGAGVVDEGPVVEGEVAPEEEVAPGESAESPELHDLDEVAAEELTREEPEVELDLGSLEEAGPGETASEDIPEPRERPPAQESTMSVGPFQTRRRAATARGDRPAVSGTAAATKETARTGRPAPAQLLKRYWYAPVGLAALVVAALAGPGVARFVGDLSQDLRSDLPEVRAPVPRVTLPKVVVPKITVRTPAFVETSVSRIGEMLSGPILSGSGEWLIVADVQVNPGEQMPTAQEPPASTQGDRPGAAAESEDGDQQNGPSRAGLSVPGSVGATGDAGASSVEAEGSMDSASNSGAGSAAASEPVQDTTPARDDSVATIAAGEGAGDSAVISPPPMAPGSTIADSAVREAGGGAAAGRRASREIRRRGADEVLPEEREWSPMSVALTFALETDLRQAGHYNVLPRERALSALAYEGGPTPRHLSVDQALSLARSEGYGAVVAARVDRNPTGPDSVGIQVLGAEGDTLYGVVAEVAADMTTLEALSGLSRAVKRRLGEPAPAVEASAPSTQLLTNSLPALESYAEARLHLFGGRYPRAIAAAHEATRRDSTFAMAYRTLAEAYALQGLRPRARAALERAWSLSGRLSERERYRLLADRLAWDGEYTDAALTYDELFKRYRDDAGALRSLALVQRTIGARGRGEGNLVVAYQIDPFDWPRLSRLARYLGYSGPLPDVDSLLASADSLP